MSPNWYAKGGLFTQPTIAGFGEAGNEAALPLENKRVMSMVADAIIKNSKSGMGIDSDELTEAVATGVAMAMAQNPQKIENVVTAILQTEDVEIARSCMRGEAILDQRYNPTPQFA